MKLLHGFLLGYKLTHGLNEKILSDGKRLLYYYSDWSATKSDHEIWCSEKGGSFPVPSSKEENDFLASVADDGTWLGDTANSTFQGDLAQPFVDGANVALSTTGQWVTDSKFASAVCYLPAATPTTCPSSFTISNPQQFCAPDHYHEWQLSNFGNLSDDNTLSTYEAQNDVVGYGVSVNYNTKNKKWTITVDEGSPSYCELRSKDTSVDCPTAVTKWEVRTDPKGKFSLIKEGPTVVLNEGIKKKGVIRTCNDIENNPDIWLDAEGAYSVNPWPQFGDEAKTTIYCRWRKGKKTVTMIPLNPEENKSVYFGQRIKEEYADKCLPNWTKKHGSDEKWEQKGTTAFKNVMVEWKDDAYVINPKINFPEYLEHSDMPDVLPKKFEKEFASGGDCFSRSECGEARKGGFQIKVTDGLQIDWNRSGDWKMAEKNSKILIHKTETEVRALCGGYCNSCRLKGELYLISAMEDSTVPVTTTTVSTTTTTMSTIWRSPDIARSHQNDVYTGFLAWLDANVRDEKFKYAMTMKIEQLTRKMLRKSEKINSRCGSYNQMPRSGKHGKYAKKDVCKAAAQLTKAFVTWNNMYNMDCRNRGRDEEFVDLMKKHFDKINIKLRKKLYCDAGEE